MPLIDKKLDKMKSDGNMNSKLQNKLNLKKDHTPYENVSR